MVQEVQVRSDGLHNRRCMIGGQQAGLEKPIIKWILCINFPRGICRTCTPTIRGGRRAKDLALTLRAAMRYATVG